MSYMINYIMIFTIIINFYILATSRFRSLLKVTAIQGALLAFLPLLLEAPQIETSSIFIAVLVFAFKGIIFPVFLVRVKRKVNIFSEIEPYVGYIYSILFGAFAIAVSIWLSLKLSFLTDRFDFKNMTAIFTIFTGLFIIISRKKAITQIIGYLILENGIYLLTLSLVVEIPLLIEIGILFDIFIAVFIMGIAVYHINREFEHIDIDKLNELKG